MLIMWDTHWNAPAFAAACTGTPQDASAGSAACDMSVSAVVSPGVLTMTNDAAAVVTGTPFTLAGANIPVAFTFNSVVKDHRGGGLGWVLSAASAGITGTSGLATGTTLPLSLATNTGSSCTNGTCAPTTFTAASPLTATTARFLTTSSAAHTTIVDGDYTNKINGTFNVPTGTPAGTYTGIITVTLLNTF